MRVMLYTSWEARCGIADYNRRLAAELEHHVTVEIVREPLAPGSVTADWHRYRALGAALNAGDLGHIHHAHSFWGGRSPLRNALPAFLAAARSPLVMTVHDVFGGGMHGWQAVPPATRGRGAKRLAWAVAAAAQEAWLRRALPRLRRLIVHADWQRPALRRAGASPAQITVIPFPVHEVEVAPRPLSRAALGIPDDWLLLALFGFPAPRKGFDTAVEALAHLPANAHLLLAGGATLPEHEATLRNLRDLAGRLGVGDRLHVTGYLPEARLPTVWGASDIVLAPFRESTGSSSLATAIAAARPIVASAIPAHREIVARQPCLHLVPPGDPTALAAAVQRITTDPAHAAALQRASTAYRHAHSVAATAARTAALYAEAAER